jgi:uncharacterized DUF497 family protein
MPRRLVFEWDEHNIEHIARHDVEPWEAEDAMYDPERIGGSAYNQGRERRWALLGITEAGRILFVVFTRRRGRVRVVMSRDAVGHEQRRYRKG